MFRRKEIKVTVTEGNVRLEGSVDWGSQKDAAEGCAKRVRGVRQVTNEIRVEPTVSAREAW